MEDLCLWVVLAGSHNKFSFALLVAGRLGILDEFCFCHSLLQARDFYAFSIKSKINQLT